MPTGLGSTPVCLCGPRQADVWLSNGSLNINLVARDHDLTRFLSTEASHSDKDRTCFVVLLVKCSLGRV